MQIGQELLFFISALGVFNGLLLSLYLLFFFKHRRLSNQLFGWLLLMLTIRIGKSVFHYFTDGLPRILLQLGLSACLFIGPFLYLYVKSVQDKKEHLGFWDKAQIITLLILITIIGIIFPYETKPWAWNSDIVLGIYAIWFIYVLVTGILLWPVISKTWRSGQSLSTKEQWLLVVFWVNLVICAVFNSVLYFGFPSYVFGPIAFSFGFYILAAAFLLLPDRRSILLFEKASYVDKKIPSREAKRVEAQIHHCMKKDLHYKDPNLKLDHLAAIVGVRSHQLSQILNDNLGKSFPTLINEYRVDAATQLLGANQHLTVEGIGQEVGFRSKSSFYAAFKKFME